MLRLACYALREVPVADCVLRIAWVRGVIAPMRLACAACCGLHVAHCALRIAFCGFRVLRVACVASCGLHVSSIKRVVLWTAL